MKHAPLLALVAVVPMAVVSLAASSCDSRSALSADASTQDGDGIGGAGGQGIGGQGTSGQGTGGHATGGAGPGTGGGGGTTFACGVQTCTVGESYCRVVIIQFLASSTETAEGPDQQCVAFPTTCLERTGCSCLPPAAPCGMEESSCQVTESARVTQTCTVGG